MYCRKGAAKKEDVMYLYLLRHGEPDYTTDTLTETGWHQAELLAKRMRISGLDRIYCSPMGRAQQTAEPTAKLLGLPVETRYWARELGEEAKTRYPDGNPKVIATLPGSYFFAPEHRKLSQEEALRTMECFTDNDYAGRYEEISRGLDELLAENGYVRNERGLYGLKTPSDAHIGLFCHGGMMRILLSHLFDIPCTRLVRAAQGHFTGVTVIYFPSAGEGEAAPQLVSYGDVGHLYEDGAALSHYTRKDLF